jgi:hypothetical protein
MKNYEEYARIKVQEVIQQGVRAQQIHKELGQRPGRKHLLTPQFDIFPLSLLVMIFGWFLLD